MENAPSGGVLCPICGSDLIRMQYHFNQPRERTIGYKTYACSNTETSKPDVLSCTNCDHWFSNPLFWPKDLESLYQEVVDHEYIKMKTSKEKTFTKSAKVSNKLFDSAGTLIEIGSYTGMFLSPMRNLGWECIGIEPSTWATEIARRSGHEIRQGTFESIVSLGNLEKADLIVSWDVVEHVRDPKKFLSDAKTLMKDSSYLVVSTLDRSSLFAKIMGRNWPWIIEMHLHYFDINTFKSLANSLGLELIKYGTHVHYATLSYMLRKLFPKMPLYKLIPTFLGKIAIPIGLGDVKYFVLKKRENY